MTKLTINDKLLVVMKKEVYNNLFGISVSRHILIILFTVKIT